MRLNLDQSICEATKVQWDDLSGDGAPKHRIVDFMLDRSTFPHWCNYFSVGMYILQRIKVPILSIGILAFKTR